MCLRDGASGIFLAASQFPRHRETRAPTVEELMPYKDQIDEKYQFLLTAPVKDPEGKDHGNPLQSQNQRAVRPQ